MRVSFRVIAASVTVALALSVAGPASAVRTKTVRTVGTNSFSPANVRIQKGAKVAWKATSYSHRIAAYGGNWHYVKLISSGQRVSRRFKKVGTFRFRCTFHSTLSGGVCSGMCGRVRVHPRRARG